MGYTSPVIKWGIITFNAEDIKTDLIMYRERCPLLIPDYHEENRFVVISQNGSTSFFIGSSSDGQFTIMKSFFERIYNCSVELSGPPPRTLHSVLYVNSRRNRKFRDFYYPQFMRNIVNVPNMVPEIQAVYSVIIRSGKSLTGRKKYSFGFVLGTTSGQEIEKALMDIMDQEIRRLRLRFRFRLRRRKKDARLFPLIMDDPFTLSSFVRIPEDEGFP